MLSEMVENINCTKKQKVYLLRFLAKKEIIFGEKTKNYIKIIFFTNLGNL
jgi:hypothetical protein